jgi:hypothetical protein
MQGLYKVRACDLDLNCTPKSIRFLVSAYPTYYITSLVTIGHAQLKLSRLQVKCLRSQGFYEIQSSDLEFWPFGPQINRLFGNNRASTEKVITRRRFLQSPPQWPLTFAPPKSIGFLGQHTNNIHTKFGASTAEVILLASQMSHDEWLPTLSRLDHRLRALYAPVTHPRTDCAQRCLTSNPESNALTVRP